MQRCSSYRNLKVFEESSIAFFCIVEHFIERNNFDVAASILVIFKIAFVVRRLHKVAVFRYSANLWREAAKDVGVKGNLAHIDRAQIFVLCLPFLNFPNVSQDLVNGIFVTFWIFISFGTLEFDDDDRLIRTLRFRKGSRSLSD